MPNKNYFAQLSPKQKAELFKIYVKDGVLSLNEIRDHYNSFASNNFDNGGNGKRWKALNNIQYKLIPDPNFTKEKTGVGDIEVMFRDTPAEGYEYANGFKYAHPSPGNNVIIFNPETNDEQDIMLDALHIMRQDDPVYQALLDRLSYYADGSDVSFNARRRMDEDIKQYGRLIPGMGYNDYFNNEIDGLLRNMFIEGTPEYIESKQYYPNKSQLREWNKELLPYIDSIEQYLITGEKPEDLLNPAIVTAGKTMSYGGKLNDTINLPTLAEYFSENYKTHLDNPIMKNEFDDGGNKGGNNNFAVRDNTRVSVAPQDVGYLPAYDRGAIGHDIELDSGPMGFIPIVGDILQGGQAIQDYFNGDYGKAALNAGLLLAPNFIEKPLKYIGKGLKNIGIRNYLFEHPSKFLKSREIVRKYNRIINGENSDAAQRAVDELYKGAGNDDVIGLSYFIDDGPGVIKIHNNTVKEVYKNSDRKLLPQIDVSTADADNSVSEIVENARRVRTRDDILKQIAEDSQNLKSKSRVALIGDRDVSKDSYPLMQRVFLRNQKNGVGKIKMVTDDGIPRMVLLNNYGVGKKSLSRIDSGIEELRKIEGLENLPGRVSILGKHYVPAIEFEKFELGGNLYGVGSWLRGLLGNKKVKSFDNIKNGEVYGQYLPLKFKEYYSAFKDYDDWKNKHKDDANNNYADVMARYYYNNDIDPRTLEFFKLRGGPYEDYRNKRLQYEKADKYSIDFNTSNSYRLKSLDKNGKPTNKHTLRIVPELLDYIYDEAIRGGTDPKSAIGLAVNESNLGNARAQNGKINLFDLFSYWAGTGSVIYPNSKVINPYNAILKKIESGENLTSEDVKTIQDLNKRYAHMAETIHEYNGDNVVADATKYFLSGKYAGNSKEANEKYHKLVISRFDELMNDSRFVKWWENKQKSKK